MTNFIATLEGMLPDNPKVSYGLVPSFSLVIDEFNVTNFDCLSVPSPLCSRLALPKTDRLITGKTAVALVKGCPGNPGRHMLESKAFLTPLSFFTLSLPMLGCGILGKS